MSKRNKAILSFVFVAAVVLISLGISQIIGANTSDGPTVYNQAKIYGPSTGSETITGDAEIDATGVQLQNMTFTGNLTVAKSVGDGDVILRNVTVDGNLYIKGGGANSVHLIDCTINGLYVERNGVRVVAEGGTTVSQVNIYAGVALVEKGITGTGFINVTVSQSAPAGITASLTGNFNSVTIKGDRTNLTVVSGTIVRMLIAQGADGTVLHLSNGVEVSTLNINAKVQVTGKGRIDSAISTVTGSTFETAPISSTEQGTGADTGAGTGTNTGTGTGTGTTTKTDTDTGSGTETGGGTVEPLNFASFELSPAGSMAETPSSPTFIMTFDRGIADHWATNKTCFKIYQDGSSTNVLDSGAVTMIDNDSVQLNPTGLVAGASYHVVVSASLQADNGSTLGTAVIRSFTVASGSGTGGGGGVAPLSFVGIALSPAGSMTETPNSPIFILTFDRGLTDHWTANQDCFKIYQDGSLVNVLDTSAVTMIDKNNIQLAPTGLEAGASYNIVVSASLQANNGNTLGTEVVKSFTVAGSSGEIAAPNYVSSEVTSSGDVSITFDKNMESTLDLSGKNTQFVVMVNGMPATTSGIQRTTDPTKIKLTLQIKASAGDVLTVQYTKGTVKAEDGGILESFGPVSVTNNLIPAPPLVSSASTGRNNDRVTISFNKAMADPSGQESAFAVTVGGTPVAVTDAVLNADTTKIDLILIAPITTNGAVTVAYTKGSVTSSDGGILETFAAQAVTNQYGSAPNFISSEVTTKGDVSLTFDKKMAAPLAGENLQFTVMVNGTAAATTSIGPTSEPTKLKIALTIKAKAGDVLTVQYIKGTVKAEDGGILESFGPVSVTNTL